MSIQISTYLRDMPVRTKVRIVGYDKAFRGYVGKLLSMGLTPGTEFTVLRYAFLNHLVQIEVQGTILSLRKPEMDALCIEQVEEE